MNRARKLLANTAGTLDLPADIVAGLPRIELTGFREFVMEPHKGLLEYESHRIAIDSPVGSVCVTGEGLRIKQMNKCRITICGVVCGIQLLGERYE